MVVHARSTLGSIYLPHVERASGPLVPPLTVDGKRTASRLVLSHVKLEHDPAADLGRPIGEPFFTDDMTRLTFRVYLIALGCVLAALVLAFRPFRGPFEPAADKEVNFHGVGNTVTTGDHNVNCAGPKANLLGPSTGWMLDWRERIRGLEGNQALVISQGSPPDSAKVIGPPCRMVAAIRAGLAVKLVLLGPILLIAWIVGRGKEKGFSNVRRYVGALGGLVALAGGFFVGLVPVAIVFFFPEGS